MAIHSIQFEGANLYAETDGVRTNPPLLLWPPGGCTLRVWDHVVPELVRLFHVIRVDIRGLGKSAVETLDEAQFTFDQYARDARHCLDAIDVDATHVWSQSWGTRAAIVFCARHRDSVKSAALYAANLGPPDVARQQKGTKDAAMARHALGIESVTPSVGFNDHLNSATVQLAGSALRKSDLIKVIDAVSMPVLIGTGSHDPNLESSTFIASRLPNATLRVFENVGHNAILEHATLALETFFEFHDALA